MALYRYKKREKSWAENEYIEINVGRDNPNIWKAAGNSYGALQNVVNSSTLAQLIIPTLFILTGLFFVYKYIYPEIQSQLEMRNGLVAQGSTTLVSGDFIDRSQYISDPSGMNTTFREAFEQNILQTDATSLNYQNIFYISIPSLGIESLPITPNVDSSTESAYQSVLTNTLAHFRNTGLPISNVQQNIVIYGHSASPNYGPRRNDPEVAFSFLPNLKVGDLVHLDIEGTRYTFRMFRSRIVEPTEVSIITGNFNQRTLTLFTCYPIGNNSQRYVAVLRPI